jgi:predicted ABC-type ATPase
MSSAAPWFVLVGGVNGAGKSTLAQDSSALSVLVEQADSPLEIINPDKVTQDVRAKRPSISLQEANKQAAVACEERVDELIRRASHSFAIETVLSTNKYRKRVELARNAGFNVLFIYLVIETVEQSIRRVARRVTQGGHDVPQEKIRKRWALSRANVPWFWEHASASYVFYNEERLVRLAHRQGDDLTFHATPPATTRALLQTLLPEWSRSAPILG